jgi:hypothetical protein
MLTQFLEKRDFIVVSRFSKQIGEPGYEQRRLRPPETDPSCVVILESQ